MRSPVLYFFLLVLRVSFDFISDVVNERSGFSENLLEECLEFVPSEGSDRVPLNLSLVLLPAKVDPILKKRGREGDMLVAGGTGYVEMVFTLPTKVVTLYM